MQLYVLLTILTVHVIFIAAVRPLLDIVTTLFEIVTICTQLLVLVIFLFQVCPQCPRYLDHWGLSADVVLRRTRDITLLRPFLQSYWS